MEIGIFYSRENMEHRQTADLIKQAVRNLGLSASITEGNHDSPDPLVVVNGIDVSKALPRRTASKNGISRTYDSIVELLERSAWNAMW